MAQRGEEHAGLLLAGQIRPGHRLRLLPLDRTKEQRRRRVGERGAAVERAVADEAGVDAVAGRHAQQDWILFRALSDRELRRRTRAVVIRVVPAQHLGVEVEPTELALLLSGGVQL